LPEIRHWFVVRPAAKRLMPAAGALRDFLVAEGRRFLPEVGLRGWRGKAKQGKKGISGAAVSEARD
jgi:hypothetical protein